MLTAEAIAFHATERPDAMALALGGRESTYADLSHDIGRFARALETIGVSPGNLVVVGTEDYHLHCVLLIALEQLGAVSASLSTASGKNARPLLSRADLLLTDAPRLADGAPHSHLMTEDWLQGVWSLPATEARVSRPENPEDPVRVLRTSGTTGATKMAMLHRRQHEGRLNRYGDEYQFTERSRYLLTMPFSVGHVYGSTMACLRAGGTLVLDPSGPTGRAVSLHGITDVTLLPLQLKKMLDELPGDFTKPDRLTICTFGAPISAALRDRALARVATILYSDYGCNEAGLICLTRASDGEGGGTIWPGVRVEVVDDDDRPVPEGEIGRIRVQTEFMVDGYLDDEAATRRMFRDGWFYPGDFGSLQGARRLRVLGRSDDLLNIGGIKCPPEVVENAITLTPSVQDAAVCALKNADGFDEIWAAVVASDIADTVLQTRVLDALRTFRLGHIHIVRMDAIPRNDLGKILRDRLRSHMKGISR